MLALYASTKYTVDYVLYTMDSLHMGMKPKVAGNQFEKLFERASIRQGLGTLRIPDGCKRIPWSHGMKLIPVKTPCDWVIVSKGRTALIDTKTMGKGETFPQSLINFDQISSMKRMQEHGAICGYIVWYRSPNRVVFLKLRDLFACPKGSSVQNEVVLGSIEESNIAGIFDGSN